MTDTSTRAQTLGSASAARRGLNVALVSGYLAAVGVWLVVTRRIRLGLPKVLRFLARRARGANEPAAETSVPASRPDATSVELASVALAAEAPPPFDLADWLTLFVCPSCGSPVAREGDTLRCRNAHVFPVVRAIPRFVHSDAYARSFSLEWNTHDQTQLDSRLGSSVSEDTLREKTGLEPADVAGKLVLDAGVGSGRFAEVLARWGARVVGVDLSLAVEAARRNLAAHGRVCIAQADIERLPFAPGSFDAIVSIGVLHHTPSTRRSFEALARLLKPGGTVVIWVYPDEASYRVRNAWIPFTSRIPSHAFYDWCRWFVPWTHRFPAHPVTRLIWDVFPFSRQGLGREWDVLDTFDGFSPRYHGIHSPAEVEGWFRDAGLVEVREAGLIHTAVRGRRPEAA